MTRKVHEMAVSVALASMMGVGLGLALHDLALGLAMGAVLPILWAAERCRGAR